MTPETRDFLAGVRRSEDPSPSDESRVLAALEARLTGDLTHAAHGDAPATNGAVSGSSWGLKVIAALVGVSAGTALIAAAVSSEPAERPAAPRTTRPLEDGTPPPRQAMPSTSPPSRGSVASAPAAPSAPRVVEPRRSAASTGSASLREEIALLAGVQSALERGDGAEALRRLDEHATHDRQFVAERRAARIAALCQLGRVPEARALAAVFLRENAQSVQRVAVERSCAGPKTLPER